MTRWRDRRHRGLFWAAVLVALVVAAGGVVVAYAGYRDQQGPEGAARGYLRAVARGDARAALGYGRPIPGATPFLTAAVLHQQLHIAPMRDITVTGSNRQGNTATVSVTYSLAFGRGELPVSDTVSLVKQGDRWLLTRPAAAPELSMTQASDRANLAGVAVPDGRVDLFPGALPVTFDTPYLRLTRDTEAVKLNSSGTDELVTELSTSGTNTIKDALTARLALCAAGGAKTAATCPVPSAEFVPGSMRGRLRLVTSSLSMGVAQDPAGSFAVSGTATFTGSYRLLDFNDIPQAKTGTLSVRFQASGYAVAPLTVQFLGVPT